MSVAVGRLQQEAQCAGEKTVPIRPEGHAEAASGRMRDKVRSKAAESGTT